jgi:hypothetical protein
MRYTEMELTIIRDCKEMGFTNEVIANFVNKKEHAGEAIRTTEAVRKVK